MAGEEVKSVKPRCASCPACGGSGEVEVNEKRLNFPAVNCMFKKREVAINTLGDLATLVTYLDMKRAGPLTPVYSENKKKMSAAIWEGIDGGYTIELRVVKENRR
jgi:hypothetical protein